MLVNRFYFVFGGGLQRRFRLYDRFGIHFFDKTLQDIAGTEFRKFGHAVRKHVLDDVGPAYRCGELCDQVIGKEIMSFSQNFACDDCGISLQELVVPVIAFKNLRTTNKKYVEVKNAELKLLSESRKISNLIFSLEFHQRQPVGDKIQPCTYSIYMTDDEGVVISDRQMVIADKTSDNAADRVFRVRFNLKAGTYDKKKVYRLVIANDIDVEEIEFHIDIAFADDFGFDL